MFASVLALGPLRLGGIVFGLIVLYYAVRRVIVNYQIRKTGGVRAPIIATNPLFGRKLLYQQRGRITPILSM